MNVEDAEEYTQSLGQIMSGGWRQVLLAERLGVPAALGMDTREWVEQRLGGYVRLSIPERREAVRELVEEGLNNVQAADVLGVSDETVRMDRAKDLAAARPDQTPEDPLPTKNLVPDEPTPIRDPEAEQEAMLDSLDVDGQYARSRLRRAYLNAVRDVGANLLPLAPDLVVRTLDDTERAALDRTLASVIEWLRAAQDSYPKRLEVIR